MINILVIGKNGYVANCFQKYLEKFNGYHVELISARNDKWKVVNFSSYDAVFNTVGLTHNDARAGTEKQFYDLNEELPYEIANKAKKEKVPIFVHMSSSIVYGNMEKIGRKKVIYKKTVPNPNSIYGKSKLAGENKLRLLEDDTFKIAIIRSPLIYGIEAPDNISKLIKYATVMPIFPKLDNRLSMIYDKNLCELVRLIILNKADGYFYPQMEVPISTSQFVKDIADIVGNKMVLTKIFNPVLKILSRKIVFIQKAFGNQVYDNNMSDAFDGNYMIFSYNESLNEIANSKEECKR